MRHLDSFRARLPNTSRPPSLHVDEFYRLENENAKQQQQNNIIKQITNEASPIGNNLVSIDTSQSDSISGTSIQVNKISFLLFNLIVWNLESNNSHEGIDQNDNSARVKMNSSNGTNNHQIQRVNSASENMNHLSSNNIDESDKFK